MLTYNLDARSDKPKYEYLYELIRADIMAGRLCAGERLPSKRTLAEHLGVSVITIESAYSLLVAEGYVDARARSGFFVSMLDMPKTVPNVPSRANGAPLEAWSGSDERDEQGGSGMFEYRGLSRIMRNVIAEYGDRLLEKPPHLGCPELRRAIAGHLLRYRGMEARPERIVIGSGAEYLYGLVAQLFGPDAVFGVEYPSYEKIRLVYEAHGARCELLPMDGGGISKDSLATTKADVLHVTPYHSFPSGVTAPAAKRLAYIAWAADREGYIVEDDFDSEFGLEKKPVETVYAMDGAGRTIYVNTFSKSLAPSMRMGYMILPDRLSGTYMDKLGFYSCTVPTFDQYVIAEYISEGYFERHLNRVRRKLRQVEAETARKSGGS